MIPLPAPVSSAAVVVQLNDVKFEYEGGIVALKGVSLRIQEGEYVALVGGNGSGKTTLAKMMNGLLRPTSGSVKVAGMKTDSCTVAQLARHVGYAFQNPDHQLFSSTVEEEVRFGPKNLGLSPEDVDRQVAHAIELMGLDEVRTRTPLSLTLGLRRKITIASIIAMAPQVIVLDEPTIGLDLEQIEDLMRNIQALNREGHTIILITHDMRLVAEHARRVVMMSQGRILLDSDPRGAFSDPALLLQCSLEPPPVTLLAHRLGKIGMPSDVISAEELVFQVSRMNGGA